ncbi:hypothetical protein PsorP6_004820 [Peronosclerospora sorghi]|uniref:Uncharacterized protein n=1 Tax=Peronosclerospora sorghi TaxID=230839 RepID=A0ACC0VKC2_9STRA|nr:hypothetical protein PsorP6_004820 [Peronosclerospora sorghi]
MLNTGNFVLNFFGRKLTLLIYFMRVKLRLLCKLVGLMFTPNKSPQQRNLTGKFKSHLEIL